MKVDQRGTAFEEHRHHLFGVAYRMLGRVSEAEDVVQDAWLRWDGADVDAIERPRAWLTTVTSRLAIDRLRSAQHRRETYVGPWLPEPLPTEAASRAAPDPADHVALADSLSMAFLSMLERLDPVERAVFLLREVFDHDYDEVAAIVDRTPTNCRQILRRAKDRLGPDRPSRFDADADDEQRMLEAFFGAATSGDIDALEALLADDVVLWSDGGPNRHAARRPVVGPHRVAMFFANIAARGIARYDEVSIQPLRLNGQPGVVVHTDGEVYVAMAFELDAERVYSVRAVVNPDKLTHLG